MIFNFIILNSILFVYFYMKPVFQLFLWLLEEKKVLGPNEPYISTSTNYSSIWKGLKYRILSKIILTWPDFSFSRLFVSAGRKHCPKSEKNHKNERHLCLITHKFTKISQNVCLINTHILIDCHARCDCKLWNALWFYCLV